MADRDKQAPEFWVEIDPEKELAKYKEDLRLQGRLTSYTPVHPAGVNRPFVRGCRTITDDAGNQMHVFAFFDEDVHPAQYVNGAFVSPIVHFEWGAICDVHELLMCYKGVIIENVPFHLMGDDKMMRVITTEENKKIVQRQSTPDELMQEFNRQVIIFTPVFEQLSQESRMLDKGAAMLIAGAACLSVRGNVWVDCNMESEWFDSSDEKNLMKFAWTDVIGKDTASSADSFLRMSGTQPSKLADDHDWRLAYITKVLKSFRKTQLTMQLYSLSPGTEAALSALVIDAMEQCPQFSVFDDTEESRFSTRSTISEHDDRVRRMTRILRRLPFTRNEFCRVAGNTLRYNISLQEGCAISTRRLNQIQVDMRNAVGVWLQFLNGNIDRIMYEVQHCWDNPESFYVFDWTTHRLKILDSQQYSIDTPSYSGTVEEEVMYQQVCGPRTCNYPVNVHDVAEVQATIMQTSSYGKKPRTKTLQRVISPYVNR
jgi:hypothetical protein